MAKTPPSMFTGKNAVQQSAHIRTVHYPNGNQGFSSANLGNSTTPGTHGGGAILHNAKGQDATKSKNYPTGANPYNNYELDKAGVLGPKVKAQNSGRYPDSPVPHSATTPDLNQDEEALQLANGVGGTLHGFPKGGVVGKT